jgi:dolichol-phosphate mannosyltransferase
MPPRFLTALPVYNEARHVTAVLDEVRAYSPDILVVDDGSTDGTGQLLAARHDLHVLRHETNRGYGAGLRSAFDFALANDYEVLVTIDCDGQHEPQRIPQFVAACAGWDVVSGSRYLQQYPGDSQPPADRRRINERLTAELNRRLGLKLTDAFCGFKAYRVAALEHIELHETGYAMPLEFWVQAVHAGLRIRELPVPLIYLDEQRSFGGSLDNADTRLRYYHEVLDRASARTAPEGRDRAASLCGKSTPADGPEFTSGAE